MVGETKEEQTPNHEITHDSLREKATRSVVSYYSGKLEPNSSLGQEILSGKGADYIATLQPGLLISRREKNATLEEPDKWNIIVAPNVIKLEEIKQVLTEKEMVAAGDAAYRDYRDGNTTEPLADIDLKQGVHLRFPVYNDAPFGQSVPDYKPRGYTFVEMPLGGDSEITGYNLINQGLDLWREQQSSNPTSQTP
jgi:hypothetical protein